MRSLLRISVSAVLLAVCATGCGPRYGPSKPEAALTAEEHAGEQVFAARCSACHYPHSDQPLHGPGLFALYRKPYLPSGAPANDDRVATTVVRGRGVMPGFGNSLDDTELAQLLAYLRTL